MSEVLILKTSTDANMAKLLKMLNASSDRKYCLIQMSAFASYQKNHPEIRFIDIEKEGFYDLSDQIIKSIDEIYFDNIYIPVTGSRAYNFGNIMEVVAKLHYQTLTFFYSTGECRDITKMNRFYECLAKKYIQFVNCLYAGEKG